MGQNFDHYLTAERFHEEQARITKQFKELHELVRQKAFITDMD
jgi:hypothetical protein